MLKWFFLLVIVAIACLGNVVAYDARIDGISKAVAFLVFNIFALSLLAFWLGGYHRRPREKGLLIVAHAGLMLAVGLAFIGWGYHGLRLSDCSFLVRERGSLSLIARWVTAHGACGWLSSALIVLGVVVSWPSAQLFYALTRDKLGAR